jgi:hypothetical protein
MRESGSGHWTGGLDGGGGEQAAMVRKGGIPHQHFLVPECVNLAADVPAALGGTGDLFRLLPASSGSLINYLLSTHYRDMRIEAEILILARDRRRVMDTLLSILSLVIGLVSLVIQLNDRSRK